MANAVRGRGGKCASSNNYMMGDLGRRPEGSTARLRRARGKTGISRMSPPVARSNGTIDVAMFYGRWYDLEMCDSGDISFDVFEYAAWMPFRKQCL